jgi:hypothetical protein
MPSLRFDLVDGHGEEDIASPLEASHKAPNAVFGIPTRARYQVVHEHRRGNFVLQNSGLWIPRTDLTILVSITTRPRSEASNLAFYKELCRNLEDSCVIESSDVIVTMGTNANVDCRFGYGRAQFKTGEL